MNSLLITPDNAADLKLLRELLKKFGITAQEITPEEREDLSLSLLMREAKGSPAVSRESIMQKLGR
jgi:hypothetical protein